MAAGLAGSAAALGAAAAVDSFWPLVVLLALAGASGSSVNAASGRAVMGWFRPDERGFALGIRQTAIPIGGALAAVTLPWLASTGGVPWAFVALACGCVVGSLAGAIWLREPPREPAPARRAGARPAPRPRDVAALTRLVALPGRADLDHDLRRALPPRAPRRLDPARGLRARGDPGDRDRGPDRRGPLVRPRRQPAPAAVPARARADGDDGGRDRGGRRSARRRRPGLRGRGRARASPGTASRSRPRRRRPAPREAAPRSASSRRCWASGSPSCRSCSRRPRTTSPGARPTCSRRSARRSVRC